jgi:hypothetical protein
MYLNYLAKINHLDPNIALGQERRIFGQEAASRCRRRRSRRSIP